MTNNSVDEERNLTMWAWSNFTEPNSSSLYESTSGGNPVESPPVEVVKLTLYAACALFGVIGNILVTVILIRIKAKETRVMDFYMINLAIADLGTLLLAFPITATRERLPFNWPFGEFVCLYVLPLIDIFHGSSVWFITATAIERYQKIARPSKVNVKLRSSFKRAKIIAVCIWVASFFVFSFPMYFVLRYREMSNGGTFCGPEWPSWGRGFVLPRVYIALMTFLSYIIPLAVTSGTFLAVSRKLNESSKFIKIMKHGEDSETVILDNCNHGGSCSPRRHAVRLAQNRRAKVILTPVVVVFAVFMLPLAILRLCVVFWPPIASQTFYNNLLYAVILCAIINSSANPVIYSVVRKDFRRQLARLFCRKKRSSKLTCFNRTFISNELCLFRFSRYKYKTKAID